MRSFVVKNFLRQVWESAPGPNHMARSRDIDIDEFEVHLNDG